MKKWFWFCALAAFLWTGTAITEEKKSFTADRHKDRGLSCAVCHKEDQPTTAASGESCLPCHTSLEAVAGRTNDFVVNPHQNHLVDSSEISCTNCHQGHKADKVACDSCHSDFKFERQKKESK